MTNYIQTSTRDKNHKKARKSVMNIFDEGILRVPECRAIFPIVAVKPSET
jgi:hypothetical protein